MLLFADETTGMGSRFVLLAVKLLAIGGGFFFGRLVGLLSARALNRWVFAKKAPETIHRLCGIVAGVIGAILVALFVFGEGGGLFGSGKGDGDGTNPPVAKDKVKGKTETPEPKEPPKKPPEKLKPPEPKPTPGDMRVAILGGSDVRDGKFYLIESDPEPRTFEQLREAVQRWRDERKDALVLVFRFQGTELGESNTEMKKLKAWVQDAKIQNRFE
jgi:hypothetical protein